MKEFKVDFKRSFKLVDNGDLTQNLHSLSFQNGILISEFDLGDIKDILTHNKKLVSDRKELKKYLEDKIKEEYIGGTDICSPCRFATRKEIYQDILEMVKSGNNE